MVRRLRWSAVALGVLLALSTAATAPAQEEGRDGQAVEPTPPAVVDDQGGAVEPGLIEPAPAPVEDIAPAPEEEIVIAPTPAQEQVDTSTVTPMRDETVVPADETVIGGDEAVTPGEPLISPAPGTTESSGAGRIALWIGVGAILVVAAGLVASVLFRTRHPRPLATR